MNFNIFNKNNIDENKIVDHVKKKPFDLEFETPQNPDPELQRVCTDLAVNIIGNLKTANEFENFYSTIFPKRERATSLEDYRYAMYRNITYRLFNYTYLLNSLDLLLNEKYTTKSININNLFSKVHSQSKELVNNHLEDAITNNENLLSLIQKYNQKNITRLEYDFVFSCIMDISAATLIEILLDKNNEKIFTKLKNYNAEDVKSILNNQFYNFINLTMPKTIPND